MADEFYACSLNGLVLLLSVVPIEASKLSCLFGNLVAQSPFTLYLFVLMASLSLCDASSDKHAGTPCLSKLLSSQIGDYL